jgi:flagellar biosynthesis protein FliR
MDYRKFRKSLIMHDLGMSMMIGGGFSGGIQLIFLGMLRIITALTISPVFGGKLLPNRLKIGICILFAALLIPCFIQESPSTIESIPPVKFLFLVAKEIIIGLLIGFMSALIFYAIEGSGQVLDAVRGQTMAQVLVPQVGEQASQFGQLNFQLAMVIFFMMSGHMMILDAFARSFQILPVLSLSVMENRLAAMKLCEKILRSCGDFFMIALEFSAPALVTLFLTDITLGFANRLASSLQVFQLGLPLKMWIGIMVVGMILLTMARGMETNLLDAVEGLNNLLK